MIFAVFAGGLAFLGLQWPTTGANQELHHRAAGSRYCDNAALDQSTKKLLRELANLSNFYRHFRATGGHQIASVLCNSGNYRFLKPETART